jgi:phosphohistidine phosphatase
MTRRHLHLLRHAKSSWDQPLADHDRPLNGRGRRSADALSRHLPTIGVAPQVVLCSSAARTTETLERIRPGLPDDVGSRSSATCTAPATRRSWRDCGTCLTT